MPTLYQGGTPDHAKEVPRRRNEHGEDMVRCMGCQKFPFITYGMELYINRDSIPTNTNIEQNVCVSLDCIFTFLNCYFFQYFVGTLKISHGLISFVRQ